MPGSSFRLVSLLEATKLHLGPAWVGHGSTSYLRQGAPHLASVFIGLSRGAESPLWVTSARAGLPPAPGGEGHSCGSGDPVVHSCTHTLLGRGPSRTDGASAGTQESSHTAPDCQGLCIAQPQPCVSLQVGASGPCGLPSPSFCSFLPFPGLPGVVSCDKTGLPLTVVASFRRAAPFLI